ncbi:hypothetical protein AB4Z17_17635 [Paenibacillus sp. TAF43_2]|uniref:hypothetical protein n=1 Tax=Paenibacillus sp. TAF43_2 TaxID=3233069 RepID=UPI003F9CC2DA
MKSKKYNGQKNGEHNAYLALQLRLPIREKNILNNPFLSIKNPTSLGAGSYEMALPLILLL